MLKTKQMLVTKISIIPPQPFSFSIIIQKKKTLKLQGESNPGQTFKNIHTREYFTTTPLVEQIK